MVEAIQFRGSPSGEIVQTTFTLPPLKHDEYLIKTTHSGLCYSDIFLMQFPLVLGHEGVGVIEQVGSACTIFKVGDRVGWGPMRSTCGNCDACMSGLDAYCANPDIYNGAHVYEMHGSLCSHTIRKEPWLFRIPDAVTSETAAPLMCGGGTVWCPLIERCKPYDRVGVVSFGGLGHLAVQFAAKMGCDVVVFSSTEDKREEAMKLGASEFYAVKGVSDLTTLGIKKPIDKIIITSSAGANMAQFSPILSTNGTLIALYTAPEGSLSVPSLSTVVKGHGIVGSCICSRFNQNKMLDFAARNKVYTIVEKFPMTIGGITDAFNRLKDGKMRYRGVVAWEY